MMKTLPTRRPRPSEEGYILVAVIFMLAILILSLAVAAPGIKKEIQRDRELETMHRGKQYARAIKLYYKKFGSYPPSVDALVKTNEIRFLRKKYIDPTTGKGEWKIIRFGQNKVPTVCLAPRPAAVRSSARPIPRLPQPLPPAQPAVPPIPPAARIPAAVQPPDLGRGRGLGLGLERG
jgi:type II secretory pathway pseudopilin PulG